MSAALARRGADAAFAGLSIVLAVDDEAWTHEGLGDLEALSRGALEAAARGAGLPADIETEIGLTLADDAAVRALNARWRDKDRPTNVLSFPIRALAPGERPGPMLGDLVLARETLVREAAIENKRLGDHFRHLLVHGMLHCLGYDHETGPQAETMEALEVAILATLGIADPYASSEPREEPLRA